MEILLSVMDTCLTRAVPVVTAESICSN